MLIPNDNCTEILNLAVQIEREKERHNAILDQLIEELLMVAQKAEELMVAQKAEEPGVKVNWTPQMFENEKLNEELRSVYNANHYDLYIILIMEIT